MCLNVYLKLVILNIIFLQQIWEKLNFKSLKSLLR